MSVTTLTPENQSMAALERAQSTRMDLAKWRGKIAHGDAASLRKAYLDPPGCLRNVWLYEPLLWAPGIREIKVMELGRAAVTDGVNLLVPFGRSSERSRLWVLLNIHIHRTGQVSLRRTPVDWDERGLPMARKEPVTETTLIDCAPLRKLVESKIRRSLMTWADAAYQCGMLRPDGSDRGDSSHLRRTLGLTRGSSGTFQESLQVRTALRICDGLDISYDEAGIPE